MLRKSSLCNKTGFTLIEGLILLLVIAICSYITFAGSNNVRTYIEQKNSLQLLERVFSYMRTDSIQNEKTHTLIFDIGDDRLLLDNQNISLTGVDFYKSSFGVEKIVINSLVSGAFSKSGSIYFSIYGKHYILVIPIGFSEVYIK